MSEWLVSRVRWRVDDSPEVDRFEVRVNRCPACREDREDSFVLPDLGQLGGARLVALRDVFELRILFCWAWSEHLFGRTALDVSCPSGGGGPLQWVCQVCQRFSVREDFRLFGRE